MKYCQNCMFFEDPGWDKYFGLCRRFPPIVPCMQDGELQEEHGVMLTDYPLTLIDGWCGEWKDKE